MTTITLFISSTFSDMESERDSIRRKIVPELQEYFSSKHIEIRLVDLRWGITTTDESQNKEDKILKVCFDEIDRSYPFFVGLLGERYGWVPPQQNIKNISSKIDINRFKDELSIETPSVTALEMFYGVLGNCDNFEASIFALRDSSCYGTMNETQRAKYLEPQRSGEIEQLKCHIKQQFSAAELDENIIEYTPTWSGERFTEMDQFEVDLTTRLKEMIDQLVVEDIDQTRDWIDQEIDDQTAFVMKRVKDFVVCEDVFNDIISEFSTRGLTTALVGRSGCGKSSIMSYVYYVTKLILEKRDDSLVLFFSSAVSERSNSVVNMLEVFSRQMAQRLGKEYTPIDHEDELSSEQTQSNSSWVSLLEVEGVDNEKTTPSKSDVAKQVFVNYVVELQEQGIQTHFVIDAFEGFDNMKDLASMFWSLRSSSILTSCLPQYRDILDDSNAKVKWVETPLFKRDYATKMAENLCQQQAKELHQSVLNAMLNHCAADGVPSHSSPLWMNLASSVLFTLDIDDFTAIRERAELDDEQKIENYMVALIESLPNDPGELFLFLVDKCAEDFGKRFTYNVLRYLSISRGGLRERDLAALLGDDWDELSFASLRRWFRPFFVERGDEKVWMITHQLFIKAINSLSAPEQITELNSNIHRRLMSLHESDSMRSEDMLYYAIKGGKNIIFEYTFHCRFIRSIKFATDLLINELISNPALTKQIKEEIKHIAKFDDEQYRMGRIMLEQMNIQPDNPMYLFHKDESSNRHIVDRVVRSLAMQLDRDGYGKIAFELLNAIEPVVEASQKDFVISKILAPKLYRMKQQFFEKAYDKQNSEIYNKKLNGTKCDIPRSKQELTYAELNDLAYKYKELSRDGLLCKCTNLLDMFTDDNWEQEVMQEDGQLKDIVEIMAQRGTLEWEKDLLDERAEQALYALCISLSSDESDEYNAKAEEYFESLFNINLDLLTDTNDGFNKIYSPETMKPLNDHIYRLKALAMLLEEVAHDVAKINQRCATTVAEESTLAYRCVMMINETIDNIAEFGLSLQNNGNMLSKLGMAKNAYAHLNQSEAIANHLMTIAPRSETSKLRILSISRCLGDLLKQQEMYKEAIEKYTEYHKWAQHLYELNPSALQWLSSSSSGSYELAQCNEHLNNVNEAYSWYKIAGAEKLELFQKSRTPSAHLQLAEIYCSYSYYMVLNKDFDEAIKCINSAKAIVDLLRKNGFEDKELFEKIETLWGAFVN